MNQLTKQLLSPLRLGKYHAEAQALQHHVLDASDAHRMGTWHCILGDGHHWNVLAVFAGAVPFASGKAAVDLGGMAYLDAEHWDTCSDIVCADYAQQIADSQRLLAAEPLHGTHTATTVKVLLGSVT